MMRVCRFHLPEVGARLGLVEGDIVRDLTSSGQKAFSSLAAWLQASAKTSAPRLLANANPGSLPGYDYCALDCAPDPNHAHLLPPVDAQEVWAAGVTYAWSREARVREAVAKDIYVRVYEATRPELFFKSTPDKVVGTNDWVGIRGDSRWNVPEPELTLLLNPKLEIVGYTIGNDMSSRDIEGENPLYLPQAKVFRHCCAIGPTVALIEDEAALADLAIRLSISRLGKPVFQGETSTAKIHRRLQELTHYLGLYNDFPAGALLLTGTGIVPPDHFTLQDGDEVAIEISPAGTLRNTVRLMP